ILGKFALNELFILLVSGKYAQAFPVIGTCHFFAHSLTIALIQVRSLLIVAGLAIGRRTYIVLFHQLKAFFNLVLNFIAHGSNFIDGAYVLFRVAVTVEAPTHAKGFNLTNNFHSVNASMAALAPHTHINVGGVIKIGVIR